MDHGRRQLDECLVDREIERSPVPSWRRQTVATMRGARTQSRSTPRTYGSADQRPVGRAANAVAADGTDVYLVKNDPNRSRVGTIERAPSRRRSDRLGDVPHRSLPLGSRTLSDPSAISVDDTCIYFNNLADGGLMEKLAKCGVRTVRRALFLLVGGWSCTAQGCSPFVVL
jgi:hypothetical protein